MSMYYKRDGTPCDVLEWTKEFESLSTRKVNDTVLPNGKWVSTVWLGLDHNLGGKKPHIFETMVFPGKNNLDELECRRYSTESEALAGHEELCKEYSK